MKKYSLFIVALLFTSLTGCGSYKAPTNEHDKVKVAFNGVEKSFKKIATKKSLHASSGLQPKYKNVDNGLSTIFSLFNESDIQGHSLDALSYNEPPMIQFQYLKAVFDKLGNGYQFGTKYYDVVTGDFYVDVETGIKDETKKAENKYSYNFNLGIDINIDSNDLINADVSFDIEFTNGKDTYSSEWYVNLLLDYDIKKSSPNYTLTLYTENDEKDIPYYDRYTYEYDYVQVEDNQISEWRKFCMHSDKRLVKDADHQSFGDYLDKDNIEYKVDYPKWFKNNNYYKLMRMGKTNERTVGNAMFDGLGLNANDINADAFFAKAGTKNSVIQEMYQKFSNIAKEDIIYDLATRDKDDAQHGEEVQIAGIRAMFSDGVTAADWVGVDNQTTLTSLFTGSNKIELWYCKADGALIEKIDDYATLNYEFTTEIDGRQGEAYMPVHLTIDETIKAAYSKLYNEHHFNVYSRRIHILIKDNSTEPYQGVLNLSFQDEFVFDEPTKPVFPEALLQLGVPEYEGQDISFDYSRDGENYSLKITGSNEVEMSVYLQKVQKAGFTKDSNTSIYVKEYNDQDNLYLQLDNSQKDYILLKVWKDQKPYEEGEGEGEGEESGLHIQSLVLVGINGDWEIASGIKLTNNDGHFTLIDITITAGTVFKFVANGDWTIHSEDTAYGGFGFDDIEELDSKGQDCIERSEGTDGNISAKRTFTTSIDAYVRDNVLRISFKGFR